MNTDRTDLHGLILEFDLCESAGNPRSGSRAFIRGLNVFGFGIHSRYDSCRQRHLLQE